MSEPEETGAGASGDRDQTIGKAFVLVILVLVCWLCARHCIRARLQYRSSSFPSVVGWMNEYYWNEFGMVESELVLEYTYVVGGRRYFGNRKRFVWREFRSGSNEAIALARSWGKGKNVRVFYDPDDPSNAALDNLFTPGDWKTLACAVAGLAFAPLIGLFLAIDVFRRVRAGVFHKRHFAPTGRGLTGVSRA